MEELTRPLSILKSPAKYKDVELKLIDYINNQRRRRATILAIAISDKNKKQYEKYSYLNIEEYNEEYEELTWNTLTKKRSAVCQRIRLQRSIIQSISKLVT